MRDLVIVGVGQIGGSVGAAVKKRRLAERVIGVEIDPAHRALAQAKGLVDAVAATMPESPSADLVVVAVPPSEAAAAVVGALEAAPNALVTDCTGLKAPVVAAVLRDAGDDAARFVGGHPMAGTAGQGPGAADPDLFVGRPVILTPTEETNLTTYTTAGAFWRSLGAEVSYEGLESHDRLVASVSHLPHLIAYALQLTASRLAAGEELAAKAGAARVAKIAGPSFAGATRVAASDPALWTQLFRMNRPAVKETLAAFQETLGELDAAIGMGERELAMLLEAIRDLKGTVPPEGGVAT